MVKKKENQGKLNLNLKHKLIMKRKKRKKNNKQITIKVLNKYINVVCLLSLKISKYTIIDNNSCFLQLRDI